MTAYGVLSFKEELGLEAMGIKTKIDLTWYDGQIGAMPVFKDYEKALSYVDGNKDKVFEINVLNRLGYE